MNTLTIALIGITIVLSTGYAQAPLPEIITMVKPSILAIDAYDDTILIDLSGNSIKYHSSGSGVLIETDSSGQYALTNEHVIAIKDTNDATIRYADSITVSINIEGLGSFSCNSQIRKVSEELDLAALRVFFPRKYRERFITAVISENLWLPETQLHEGETVLYSGYPLRLGRGKANTPLTRTGIISQIESGSKTFLIDAFVQPGYSGSPVFVTPGSPI